MPGARWSSFGLQVSGNGEWGDFLLYFSYFSSQTHQVLLFALCQPSAFPPSGTILLTTARVTVLKLNATPVTLQLPSGQSPSPLVWLEREQYSWPEWKLPSRQPGSARALMQEGQGQARNLVPATVGTGRSAGHLTCGTINKAILGCSKE